eukprot:10549016-Heterocapsa_arctica.AAC.1
MIKLGLSISDDHEDLSDDDKVEGAADDPFKMKKANLRYSMSWLFISPVGSGSIAFELVLFGHTALQ